MRGRRLAGGLLATLALVVASAAEAGAAAYMKLGDIQGESHAVGFEGQMEIESFSWGMSRSAAHGGGGAGHGKVVMQDFSFTKQFDRASPPLMVAAASGRRFPCAQLSATRGGERPVQYLTITFEDLLISSYQTSGRGDTAPADKFSINFARIEFEYKPQKQDGSLDGPVTGGWDFLTRKQFSTDKGC